MMMHKPTKPATQTIAEKEQDEKELIIISILKKELLDFFKNYKSSRTGLITSLFRDPKLTKEKLDLVDTTIQFIKDFEGTKESLIEELKNKRLKNAELSRLSGKFHFNLMEQRELIYKHYEEGSDDVRKGESSNQSGLAAVFHDAIEIVTQSTWVSNNIRNCQK